MQKYILIFFILISNYIQAECPCTSKNLPSLSTIELKIQQRLYPEWILVNPNNQPFFTRNYFVTLTESIPAIQSIAITADELQHHPDLVISNTYMQISIHTHAQKTVTRKDIMLISRIEGQLKNLNLLSPLTSISIKKMYEMNDLYRNNNLILETELKDNLLILKIHGINFSELAYLLSLFIELESFITECNNIKLSYGSCYVYFQNNTTHTIENSTKQVVENCIHTFNNYKNIYAKNYHCRKGSLHTYTKNLLNTKQTLKTKSLRKKS